MKALLSFGLLMMTSFIALAHTAETSGKEELQNPSLAKELIKMRDTDQKLRRKWAGMYKEGKTDSKKYKKVTAELLEADRSNTARMKEVIREYGWPTFDMVGERAASSAWILAQHADRDPVFQAECLELMTVAYEAGQAKPRNYAYLYDRVQVAFARKQLYATQSSSNNGMWEGSFFPIEDESRVQERRTSMGVTLPVVEYAKSMNFEYTVPSPEEAVERAVQLEQSYNTHIEQGREASGAGDYELAIEHYQKGTLCYGHVQAEDFVELARLIGLAGSDDYYRGYASLVKAGLLGWDGIYAVETNTDFSYIQESEENWSDLLRFMETL